MTDNKIKAMKAKKHKEIDLVLDSKSFFVISIDPESRTITVRYYRPIIEKNGMILKGIPEFEISGDNGRDIYRDISSRGLISRIDHAAYLGYELARAENAIKNGKTYIQE